MTASHSYISSLVKVWREITLSPFSSDSLSPQETSSIAKEIKKLSNGLTLHRDIIGRRYLDDPKMLGAYLLYWWSISYEIGQRVLSHIDLSGKTVVDVGSGPGPLAFSALDLGAKQVILLDFSKLALDVASNLAMMNNKMIITKHIDLLKMRDMPEADVVIYGNVINELTNRIDIQRIIDHLSSLIKQGVTLVLIEPAMKQTSRFLIQIRDVLIRNGGQCIWPCLNRGLCPALNRPRDWCHGVWDAPDFVKTLAEASRLKKEEMKATAFIFSNTSGDEKGYIDSKEVFRIVSDPLHSKGMLRYIGCGKLGRFSLTLQKKHLSVDNQAFANLQRYQICTITDFTIHEDYIRLSEKSNVKTISLF